MQIDDLSSPAMQALLLEQHAKYPDWGKGGRSAFYAAMPHFNRLGCVSLLDYGCGKGATREELASGYSFIDWRGYDPGVPEFRALPEPADFVLSVSALENVEPEKLDNVLKHIYSLGKKGWFLSITTTAGSPDAPKLPDGSLEHRSVHDAQWWMNTLCQLPWKLVKSTHNRKKLYVWFVH